MCWAADSFSAAAPRAATTCLAPSLTRNSAARRSAEVDPFRSQPVTFRHGGLFRLQYGRAVQGQGAHPRSRRFAGFDLESAGKHEEKLATGGRVPVLMETPGHIRDHRA